MVVRDARSDEFSVTAPGVFEISRPAKLWVRMPASSNSGMRRTDSTPLVHPAEDILAEKIQAADLAQACSEDAAAKFFAAGAVAGY
jgi:hypothetical protein